MIDLDLLREHPERATAQLHKKNPQFDTKRLINLDTQLRSLRLEVETLRSKKNELARQARDGITEKIREQSKAIGAELKKNEQQLEIVEKQFKEIYLSCPNIPLEEVPVGGKEQNKVIKEVGSKPTFTFPVKNHLELVEQLGWVDFKTAAKLAGNNFVLYKKEAVSVIYALTQFMLKQNRAHGFEPILPPIPINAKSLEVSGNFPKFKEQVYAIPEDHLYLSPTAEVALVNMYRDEIMAQEELPIRMTAWTSCFRREAGTYGAHERGLIRLHQFEKVELVTLCEPKDAEQEFERMLACAETILQKLDLHYRISLLASEDMSFQAAKTYDIEVWLPGQKAYYEVSSVSNCTDFQARRGLIRYRKADDKKTHLVYTLNASSLALPRLMVAIFETYQQADGTIIIPDVLKKEMWL